MTTLYLPPGEPLAPGTPVGDPAGKALPAAEDAGISPGPLLAVLPGERMSVAGQIRTGFRAMMLRWRDLNSREGGLAHAIYHGKGDSLAELDEYTRSRAWVATGHDGGIAELTVVAWNRSAGWVLVALGGWIRWTGARWLRGTLTFLALYVLAVIVAYATGAHALAGWMTGGLAIFAVTAYILLAFLAGRRHRSPHSAAERED